MTSTWELTVSLYSTQIDRFVMASVFANAFKTVTHKSKHVLKRVEAANDVYPGTEELGIY